MRNRYLTKYFLIIFLLFPNPGKKYLAQSFTISGKVTDQKEKPLSYANIRVKDTYMGTSANIDGRFLLRLPKGNYYLITSYIGFLTDTTKITLNKNKVVSIQLKPTTIKLPVVTVKPGFNPAIPIIKRAIDYKLRREELLKTYIYNAYTKIIVRSPEKLKGSKKSVSVNLTKEKKQKLKITAVIENLSRGYFKSPVLLKEKIFARKQTATIPANLNIITGGRIYQNFYDDKVMFFGTGILSPIGNGATDYYYYYIKDTLTIDNKKVYKIYFNVINESMPGFYGYLYIKDEIFSLIKIDANVNASANPGGVFNAIHILQQYLPYEKTIYMPIDYRLTASGNILGLFPFKFNMNVVFYNYQINTPLPPEAFNNAVISVAPNADKRDSTFWIKNQKLPNTEEETLAYRRLDSLMKAESRIGRSYSPFSFSSHLTENIRMSGLFSLYSFNRMEGHKIKFFISGEQLLNKRLNTDFNISYGINDKKLKERLFIEYLIGQYRTNKISISLFNYAASLFEDYDKYGDFSSILLNLLTKWDFRSYYYRQGIEIKGLAQLNDYVSLSSGLNYYKDNNGRITTEFSLLKRKNNYPPLTLIDKGEITVLRLSLNFDFRKYIEDGYFRRRVWGNKTNLIFNIGISYGRFAGRTNYSFKNFYSGGMLNIPSFFTGPLSVKFKINYSRDFTPFQLSQVLPGNLEGGGKDYSFRTVRLNKIFGNQVYSLYFKSRLSSLSLSYLGLSFLNKIHLKLGFHLSAAIIRASYKFKSQFKSEITEFKKPLIEAGFEIGHQLFPFNLEFTWRLTHLNNARFVIGINSAIM